MLQRFSTTLLEVTVNTATATSEAVNLSAYGGGMVIIPTTAGASVTSITYYVAEKEDGTYLAAYDEDGVAVTQTVSHSKAYAIPSALFGARFVKLVTNAAGTLILTLKG